jgi:hypothetical protein
MSQVQAGSSVDPASYLVGIVSLLQGLIGQHMKVTAHVFQVQALYEPLIDLPSINSLLTPALMSLQQVPCLLQH